MVDPDALARLRRSVGGWNTWRAANRGPVDLSGVDLIGARLAGADLSRVALVGAYLIGADLRGADLRLADLRATDLRGADLAGTDLSTALFLVAPQLELARGDAATRLPSALDRPAHWSDDVAQA